MAQGLKRVRRIFVILGIVLLFCVQHSVSEAVVERIVAIVNQEIITLSEVERMVGHLKEEIEAGNRLERREQKNELFRKALDRLIEEKLLDQEAKRSKMKVSGKEVEALIEDVKQKSKATQEDLERALANDGLTLEGYKKEIEKRILRTKFVNWAVRVDTKPGEKERRDYYQKNIDQYRTDISYRPGHILFRIPEGATSEQVREIRKRCQKVLDGINAGEDFGKMATLYSEEDSGKDGGDLGYFKKGELLPALEKEILRLSVGEVTGIVRTEFGLHIIKLLDRKGGDAPPFEEMKEKIQADYLNKEFEKALNQLLKTLREKSVIEIKL